MNGLLHTVIKENLYQDSVSLMLLTNHLSAIEGVDQVQVMMGTPANIDIFKGSGLYTEELDAAKPNDLCIVVDTKNEETVDKVIAEIDLYLSDQSTSSKQSKIPIVRTWDMAQHKLVNADLALLSIAGEYAAKEANKALDRGLNVFLFSDNVSLAEERRLKQRAQKEGLLVMGPDCGTGILNGVPLAFANVVNRGNIGIVGASGTGIQEVSTIITRRGGGISQAIGTGGRDLLSEIGAITTIEGLKILDRDPETDVIVYISKPPAPSVREKVDEVFKSLSKPIVAIYMGIKPKETHENIYYTWTLEETANKALELANKHRSLIEVFNVDKADLETMKSNQKQRFIKGYYCGGTLAQEAAMIVQEGLGLKESNEHEGVMLRVDGHEIIDLGDDAYTHGRAHPMIDPSFRVEKVEEVIQHPETAVILLDNVIGYGANEDMAGMFASVIQKAKEKATSEHRPFIPIASVTGTADDPQVYQDQVDKLESAGVIVTDSNAQAAQLAVEIVTDLTANQIYPSNSLMNEQGKVTNLISKKPHVINVGLQTFAEAIQAHGGKVVQYQWSPIAGGNKRLEKILEQLQ